jgi:hypothetical protein
MIESFQQEIENSANLQEDIDYVQEVISAHEAELIRRSQS